MANVAAIHFAGLSIGYFIDSTSVGFFSLALTVTAPLTMIANSVGTTLFKNFANSQEIPIKATIVTIALSIYALILFLLFSRLANLV